MNIIQVIVVKENVKNNKISTTWTIFPSVGCIFKHNWSKMLQELKLNYFQQPEQPTDSLIWVSKCIKLLKHVMST